MKTLRSVGAVLAGLVVVVVLSTATDAALHASGVFPSLGKPMSDMLFAVAALYRFVYGVASGFVAARLAPAQPMRHAMILGVIGLALGALGAALTWNNGPEFGPHWYPLVVAVSALPACWLGGRLAG